MPIIIRKRGEVARSIRFDERLDFGLELLARQQRRSVNSLVQWAVERLLDDPHHGLVRQDGAGVVRSVLGDLWDFDETDRVLNVAIKFPALLDDRWRPVWKSIQDDPSLWTEPGTPNRRKIKQKWDTLKSTHMGKTVGRPRTKR